MPFYARYRVLKRLPARLTYRNAVVALECVRDVAAMPPEWIFRARKLGARTGTGAGVASPPPLARTHATTRLSAALRAPLPTVSPIALAAAAEREAGAGQRQDEVVITFNWFSRQLLEQRLRDGVILERDTPQARLMDALVKLGYARREFARARDIGR